VGRSPSGIAYDPDKGLMFVADSYDNSFSVISDSTNTVVANITGLSGVAGIAYNSAKREIFVGNAVISDSNNAVVAYVPEALGSIVYDSGKGEIFGAGSTAIDVISDSSSTITSANPTSSSSTVSSPSPTVPEFSSVALISLAATLVVVTLVAVAVTARSRKELRN
jgi:YVTN family beta-propeller protein